MNTSSINRFITDYLICLKERTTKERVGFDWVIYNLGIAKNWTPLRLPFFRSFESKNFKFKTEAEFGIDLAFLNANKNELIIFVLKDEKLNNANWTKNNFDEDIRKASGISIDFKKEDVKEIKIILCYNQDEDSTGIKLFDSLITRLQLNNSPIVYERWNLTKLVDEVRRHLLTSELLPQDLSGILSYICSQFQDFELGTNAWNNQLIPNWKNFLDRMLTENPDKRKLRLVPVVLLIIKATIKDESKSNNPSWIDILEWALLKLWKIYLGLADDNLKEIVWSIWMSFYVVELETFLDSNKDIFLTEHGFNSKKHSSGYIVPIADSYIAFWYAARIGIYSLSTQEFLLRSNYEDKTERIDKLLRLISEWMKTSIKVNPAILRPLIDLNHIELFLIWLALYQGNETDEILNWLVEMENRLITRRISNFQLPFIEGRNNLELLTEYAATQKKPFGYVDDSSYLLLMILELSFILPEEKREKIIRNYYKHIVEGIGDDGSKITDSPEIELQSWEPSDLWHKNVFEQNIMDGVAISTGNFKNIIDENGNTDLADKIKSFIQESITKFPNKINFEIPQAAYILACVKNKSPLPPFFWRNIVFPNYYKQSDEEN